MIAPLVSRRGSTFESVDVGGAAADARARVAAARAKSASAVTDGIALRVTGVA
jgi:hypothetical protein